MRRLIILFGALSPIIRGAAARAGRNVPVFSSIHDAWLHGLRSREGVVPGDAAELTKLKEQILQWRRPIDLSVASPFRLCFRLEEPNATKPASGKKAKGNVDRWFVRYLLQPTDDLSLQVPVEDAWNLLCEKGVGFETVRSRGQGVFS